MDQPSLRFAALTPSQLFGDALGAQLAELPGVQWTGSVRKVGRLEALLTGNVDVILVGPILDRSPYLNAARYLSQDGFAVLAILGDGASDALIDSLIGAGISAILGAEADMQDLASATAAIRAGRRWRSPSIADRALDGATIVRRGLLLTDRQRQVVSLLATHGEVDLVANVLGITRASVRSHLSHAGAALGRRGRFAIVTEAQQQGLLDLPLPSNRPPRRASRPPTKTTT